MNIRAVTTHDNPSVRELIHTVMPEFGAVGPGFALSDPEVDTMAEAYAAPRSVYLVLVEGGRLVGGGGYAPLEGAADDVAELRKMYLYPAVRGQGHGKRLLEELVQRATAEGFAHLYLETMSGMTAARGLYERFGFVRLDGPWGATGHDGCDVHYARTLPTSPSAAASSAPNTASDAEAAGPDDALPDT
ncbi:MAG: GNAT family N-acetyltransferase [Myxococcota bacterium]